MFTRLNNLNPREFNGFLLDATAVEVDINTKKEYIKKEKLEKLKLKWGYSKNKKHYIGFKVVLVLNEETLCPVTMITLPGSPNDTKTLDMVLKELKRRRIIKPFDKIIADRGYPSLENYKIAINKYKIIPILFPKKNNQHNQTKKHNIIPIRHLQILNTNKK